MDHPVFLTYYDPVVQLSLIYTDILKYVNL